MAGGHSRVSEPPPYSFARLNASTTGNPFFLQTLRDVSIGRDFGGL